MKYRLLGNSGLRVSEVSLGTMTFGEDWDTSPHSRGSKEAKQGTEAERLARPDRSFLQ